MDAAKDILIWGAGAIGGTVGAYLRRAGLDVTFVDIVPAHVAAISGGQGLKITGPIDEFTVSAPAVEPGQLTGKWKRIFLCVKAQDTRAACASLAPHLADDGYVLSLQNGLCEIDIADIVGRDRTIGAFVNFGADWIGPGEIMFSNRAAVVIGELDGARSARAIALLADLQVFEPAAVLSDDVDAYLWGKLGYASLLFAQATGMSGIADCLARPELTPLWRRLAGEVMEVARAVGTSPRGFNGFAPDAFLPPATEARAKASIDAMVRFNRPNPKTHSGIWRDLAVRKRRTEVDAQLGVVVTTGKRLGIPCPSLSALVAMIHEIEDGQRPLDERNLNDLLEAT